MGVLNEFSEKEQDVGIKFAWESKNPNYDDFFKTFDHSKPTHLVVIGYSFPFANREIDRLILKRLIPGLYDSPTDSSPPVEQSPTTGKFRYARRIDTHIQVPTVEDYNNIKDRIMSLAGIPSDDQRENLNFYHRADPKNFFIPNAL